MVWLAGISRGNVSLNRDECIDLRHRPLRLGMDLSNRERERTTLQRKTCCIGCTSESKFKSRPLGQSGTVGMLIALKHGYSGVMRHGLVIP
jgi:hypothetical protein